MPMTIEIPESTVQEIQEVLEMADCKNEREFVLKAIHAQLKAIRKHSPSAVSIQEWLNQTGFKESDVLKDFEEFRKSLNREQFLMENE